MRPVIWGIKWPYWHTLAFSDETRIDMRYVCPSDVKKMLIQRARSVYWKKWAAKHQHEELKEGAWLEPALQLQQEVITLRQPKTGPADVTTSRQLKFGKTL